MPLTSRVLQFSVWHVSVCSLKTVVVQAATVLCEVVLSHILEVGAMSSSAKLCASYDVQLPLCSTQILVDWPGTQKAM
jgi:hypothetical protein